jgi:hypothetical protein
MKMPRRIYPPLAPSLDIFGLPRLSLLGEACESAQERQRRIAKVADGVTASFHAAVSHLGEEQARKLFAKVVRRPARGPGKDLAPDRDVRLLKAYDEANGESIAAIAKRIVASYGIELGNTAKAVATQIRKLRDDRIERDRAAAREARRSRMSMHGEPPSLLSAAIATPRKE